MPSGGPEELKQMLVAYGNQARRTNKPNYFHLSVENLAALAASLSSAKHGLQ